MGAGLPTELVTELRALSPRQLWRVMARLTADERASVERALGQPAASDSSPAFGALVERAREVVAGRTDPGLTRAAAEALLDSADPAAQTDRPATRVAAPSLFQQINGFSPRQRSRV